jgi:GTPase SAR1 family protein
MYDCTYEKSFLNVRDWINVIMDSSDKRVPIVLIGNKTDLRDQERKTKKVVEYDDGKRIADVKILISILCVLGFDCVV